MTDFLAGWKVIPVKTFRQGYRRTWIVRATDQPMSTKLQHEFGLAVIKHTVMQKARQDPGNSKMDAGIRAEENRKRCSLSTDLGSSGRSASAAQNSDCQRTKKDNRSAGNIPAKQNSESEHITHCDGPWRCCTNTRSSSSSGSHDGGRPCGAHRSCSRNSNGSSGCTVENATNRDHRDEKCGGNNGPRWNGRHLRCGCPDNTCLHCSSPCVWDGIPSRTWVVGCLGLFTMNFLCNSVISSFCAKKRPRCKIWTEHKCDTSDRQILAARWIGKRRHRHIRMRRCKKNTLQTETVLACRSLGYPSRRDLPGVVSCPGKLDCWECELVRLLCQDLSQQRKRNRMRRTQFPCDWRWWKSTPEGSPQ